MKINELLEQLKGEITLAELDSIMLNECPNAISIFDSSVDLDSGDHSYEMDVEGNFQEWYNVEFDIVQKDEFDDCKTIIKIKDIYTI